ncbi:MAG: type III-B CRISPR module RAMP protein Cmr1 [Bacteroidales bacterium]|nr:type III-B CRISPR module RAMP protein Cmr1 [Bacteroidales bacterium]
MKSITFHCEVITPMFLAGADGKTPELRPPSIKGALRFWWRALNGHLSLEKLREKEAEIFGWGGTKARKSSFSIAVIPQEIHIAEKPLVPHKAWMTQKAITEGSTFEVTFYFKTEKYYDLINNLFIVTSFLGGFGKRVRRGMGSFRIKKVIDENGEVLDNYEELAKINIDNLKSLLSSITEYKYIAEDNLIQFIDKNYEKYPFLRTIQFVKLSNTNNLERELRVISDATHSLQRKYENDYGYSMGMTRGGRFASPIVTQFAKGSYSLVISKLATFPKPKFRVYVKENIQEEFITNVLDTVKKKIKK